jgi:hypothetical protein
MIESIFEKFILNSWPLRRVIGKKIAQKLNIGSYEWRLRMGTIDRPYYGYCVYNAALLAKKLNYKRISIIEFGVFKGGGLLNLEFHASEITRLLGVEIDIYGFDTGEGLPDPIDYRDLPYHWQKGFFKMDVPLLKSQLEKSKLILGNVKDTAKNFFKEHNPAPIGAIFYDFDFYSSTVDALNMLDAGEKYYLPRVFTYFDDTMGNESELYNDYTGQRLAINEFNQAHKEAKLGIPYYLFGKKFIENWYYQIMICHFFKHSRYNDFVSDTLIVDR